MYNKTDNERTQNEEENASNDHVFLVLPLEQLPQLGLHEDNTSGRD
jgi:hypothetical protein